MKILYDYVQENKKLPNKDELWGMLFVALVVLEEYDFDSVRALLQINGGQFYAAKRKYFPDLTKPKNKRRKK